MSKLQVHKTAHKDNYHLLSNQVIYDTDLSPQARLLLIYMLTRPDNWEYKPEVAMSYIGVGKRKYKDVVRELKEQGYLTTQKVRLAEGRAWEYIYHVFEVKSPEASNNQKVMKVPCRYVHTGTLINKYIYKKDLYKELHMDKDHEVTESEILVTAFNGKFSIFEIEKWLLKHNFDLLMEWIKIADQHNLTSGYLRKAFNGNAVIPKKFLDNQDSTTEKPSLPNSTKYLRKQFCINATDDRLVKKYFVRELLSDYKTNLSVDHPSVYSTRKKYSALKDHFTLADIQQILKITHENLSLVDRHPKSVFHAFSSKYESVSSELLVFVEEMING